MDTNRKERLKATQIEQAKRFKLIQKEKNHKLALKNIFIIRKYSTQPRIDF